MLQPPVGFIREQEGDVKARTVIKAQQTPKKTARLIETDADIRLGVAALRKSCAHFRR